MHGEKQHGGCGVRTVGFLAVPCFIGVCVKLASYYDWLFIMHERTSMKSDPGIRLSRFAEQKQRARRVRIGVMLVLCALPVAVAFASIPTLLEVASM
jgi:hypothetical protein